MKNYTKWVLLLFTFIITGIFLMLTAFKAFSQQDKKFYELRVYYAQPDKLEDLHARFRDHTTALFEKHGMENVGYWVPMDNPENKLIYILAYPDREARDRSWNAFGNDPAWKEVREKTEENGSLVAKVESTYMEAADFSPKLTESSFENPVFEMRIYKTPTGKLGALSNRFKDHTMALFEKHGMHNVAYWKPVDKDKGAENTLIYILAHKSKEAGEQSFTTFREDPAWQKVHKASEKNGPIVSGIESIYMVPTDYSEIQK